MTLCRLWKVTSIDRRCDHSLRICTPFYIAITLLLGIERRVTVISLLAFECLVAEVINLLVLLYLTLLVFGEIVAVVLEHVSPSVRSGLVVPQDPLFLCRPALCDLFEGAFLGPFQVC